MLRIAFEYHGKQHYEYVPAFTGEVQQSRDAAVELERPVVIVPCWLSPGRRELRFLGALL